MSTALPSPVVIIDLETTGLSGTDDCVWEVGLVVLRPRADASGAACWELADKLEQTVRPHPEAFQARHRETIQRVSGLTCRELLALWDAPPAEVVVPAVGEWLHGVLGEGPCRLASWNLDFEKRFLESERFPLAHRVELVTGLHYLPCLMQTVGRKHASRTRWKLAEACRHFALPETGHRALADAAAAALVAIHADVLPPLHSRREPVQPVEVPLNDRETTQHHYECLPDCLIAAEAVAQRLSGAHVHPLFARVNGHVERVGYAVHNRVAKLSEHRIALTARAR